MDRLADTLPALPVELDDRAADGWEPLLAIADLAGEGWPERARRAALALSTGEDREDDSLGVQLLADVQAVFEEQRADRLTSADLVAALLAREEAPWGDLRGRALDTRRLARMLRPYGVRPHNVRIGTSQAKGYALEDFADAFARYTPIYPSQALAGC